LTKGSDKRRMLERLYPEYVFLCSFAHGHPDALLFKMMFNKNARVSTTGVDIKSFVNEKAPKSDVHFAATVV